jgi:hypothetical protein
MCFLRPTYDEDLDKDMPDRLIVRLLDEQI